MPLEQRVIEPIFTSRGTLPLDASGNLALNVPNELECVTNGSLANVIRQLSSLSRHADDLFGNIIAETRNLIDRTSGLQGRIDRIAIKVTQLDSSVDEVSLLDAQKKNPFKSSTSYDQQVVSRSTMPASLMEQYKLCDTPPPLSKLNVYREDGKDGLKFYTDPSYFFELWKTQEMSQQNEREARRKAPGHKVAKSNVPPNTNGILPNSIVTDRSKKPRPPNNSRQRYQEDARDPEFLPTVPTHTSIGGIYSDSNGGYNAPHLHQVPYHPHPDAYGTMRRPNSLEVENRHAHPSSSNMNNSYGNHQVPQTHPHHQQHLQYQQQSNQQHLQHYQHSSQQYQQPQASPGASSHTQYGQSDGRSTPMNRKLSTPGSSSAGGSTSRPSQPPPAPPSSSSSSGQATPTQAGTPSRGSRGASLTRDILPPPPLPPAGLDATVNGVGDHINIHNSNHVHHSQQNVSNVPPPPPMNTVASAAQNSLSSLAITNGSINTSAPVPPPPPPPPPIEGLMNLKIQPQSQTSNNYPPPLPNDQTDSSNIISNSSNTKQNESMTNGINNNNNRLASTPSFAQQIVARHSQLQPATARNNNRLGLPENASVDARTELLAAIREGKQLRRVEGIRQREVERISSCNDVASILARRAALMELSDSDPGEEDGSDCESDDPWNDDGQS